MQSTSLTRSTSPGFRQSLLAALFFSAGLALLSPVATAGVTSPDTIKATVADAKTWRWHTVESKKSPTARHENGFVAVGDRLYLIGGRGDRPLDIFDPISGKWSQGKQPPMEIHHLQAVAYDNKLYVVGALTGGFPEEPPIANVLIYDPAADEWSTGAEIPADRLRGTAGVIVHDELIYLVGGNSRGHMSGFVSWLDVFDPKSGKWTKLPDAPHARDHFHAVVIDGKIYAAGGRTSSHDTGEVMSLTVAPVDVYDIAEKRWSTLKAPLPTQRAGTAAIEMDGKLLVIGGESTNQVAAHDEVEMYDPVTEQWSSLQSLPSGRHGTQAAILKGKLYIAAGSGNRGGGPELNDNLVLSTTKN